MNVCDRQSSDVQPAADMVSKLACPGGSFGALAAQNLQDDVQDGEVGFEDPYVADDSRGHGTSSRADRRDQGHPAKGRPKDMHPSILQEVRKSTRRFSLCQRCGLKFRWDATRNGWEVHAQPSSSASSALPPPSLETIIPHQQPAWMASTPKTKIRPSMKRGAHPPLPVEYVMNSQQSEMSVEDFDDPSVWGDPTFRYPDSDNPGDAPYW